MLIGNIHKKKSNTLRYHSFCQTSYGAHVAPQRCTTLRMSKSILSVPFYLLSCQCPISPSQCPFSATPLSNLSVVGVQSQTTRVSNDTDIFKQ